MEIIELRVDRSGVLSGAGLAGGVVAYFPRGFGSYTLDCKKYPSGSARIPVTLMEMDDAVVLLPEADATGLRGARVVLLATASPAGELEAIIIPQSYSKLSLEVIQQEMQLPGISAPAEPPAPQRQPAAEQSAAGAGARSQSAAAGLMMLLGGPAPAAAQPTFSQASVNQAVGRAASGLQA